MFEFTSSVFFWSIINFAVLLFLVNKFALPPFYQMLKDNEKRKQDLIDSLESQRKESQALLNDYKAKMAGIQEEARQILNAAKLEKEEIKKRELERLAQEKQTLLAGIRGEIEFEKKKLMDDLKENAVDLVVSATRKIIAKEFSKADHEQLIRENIREFETLLR